MPRPFCLSLTKQTQPPARHPSGSLLDFIFLQSHTASSAMTTARRSASILFKAGSGNCSICCPHHYRSAPPSTTARRVAETGDGAEVRARRDAVVYENDEVFNTTFDSVEGAIAYDADEADTLTSSPTPRLRRAAVVYDNDELVSVSHPDGVRARREAVVYDEDEVHLVIGLARMYGIDCDDDELEQAAAEVVRRQRREATVYDTLEVDTDQPVRQRRAAAIYDNLELGALLSEDGFATDDVEVATEWVRLSGVDVAYVIEE